MFEIRGNFTHIESNCFNLFKEKFAKKYEQYDGDKHAFFVENVLDENDQELQLFYGKIIQIDRSFELVYQEIPDKYYDECIVKYKKIKIDFFDDKMVCQIELQPGEYPKIIEKQFGNIFRRIISSF